jgi:hypothetical protein
MIFHPPAAAARPVPFPEGATTLKRLKWLQREVEHIAMNRSSYVTTPTPGEDDWIARRQGLLPCCIFY